MRIKDISTILPKANYVLVKVSGGNRTVKLLGMDMEVDITFNPEYHADVYGEVVKVPDKLYFKKNNTVYKSGQMMWKTDIDIKPGDMVWFDYLTALSALGSVINPMAQFSSDKYVLTEDGQLYIFVHYEQLYMRVRDGKETMLNGYMLLEKFSDTSDKFMFFQVKDRAKIKLCNFARVINVGKKNHGYYGKEKDADVEKGEIVVLKGLKMREVEKSEHQTYKRPKYVAQARYVVAKITSEDVKRAKKVSWVQEGKSYSKQKAHLMSGVQLPAAAWPGLKKKPDQGKDQEEN